MGLNFWSGRGKWRCGGAKGKRIGVFSFQFSVFWGGEGGGFRVGWVFGRGGLGAGFCKGGHAGRVSLPELSLQSGFWGGLIELRAGEDFSDLAMSWGASNGRHRAGCWVFLPMGDGIWPKKNRAQIQTS
jgi:hypothetical protein